MHWICVSGFKIWFVCQISPTYVCQIYSQLPFFNIDFIDCTNIDGVMVWTCYNIDVVWLFDPSLLSHNGTHLMVQWHSWSLGNYQFYESLLALFIDYIMPKKCELLPMDIWKTLITFDEKQTTFLKMDVIVANQHGHWTSLMDITIVKFMNVSS